MKKGFTIVELLAVIIILSLLAIFIIPNISNLVGNKIGEVDELTKETIRLATKNYLNNYDTFEIEKDNYCVSINDLITSNLLDKSLDELADYKYVFAQFNGKNTNYTLLKNSCHLKDILKEKYNSSATYGLLKDSNGYYYKGTNTQVNNNYVLLNDIIWRIISINNNDEITLISESSLKNDIIASSVWNNKQSYDESLVNKYLNDNIDGFYKSLSNSTRSKINNTNLNIGLYSNVSSITTNNKVGLLDYNQFIKTKSTDSFLKSSNSFALGSIGTSSSCIYIVNTDGNAVCGDISSPYDIRPVITIRDLAVSPDDNGTIANPYGKIY